MLCRCELRGSCARTFDGVQNTLRLAFVARTNLFASFPRLGDRLLVAVEDGKCDAEAQTENRSSLASLPTERGAKDQVGVLFDDLKMQLAFHDLVLRANTEQTGVLCSRSDHGVPRKSGTFCW